MTGGKNVHAMFPKISPEKNMTWYWKLKPVVGQKSIVAATGQKSDLIMMFMSLRYGCAPEEPD